MIVRKAVRMAQHVGVPIIGIIENMSYFISPDTGKRHFIFGLSHADEVAKTADAPVLAMIPIDPDVSAFCDAGDVEKAHPPEIEKAIGEFIQSVSLHPAKSG